MKYKISDLAKIFDVTTETIRHYESKGLLQSFRDENNNYRLFDDWDIFDLSDYLNLKKCGFTLLESKLIFESNSSEILTDKLNNKMQELSQTIHEKTVLLDWLHYRRKTIKHASLNIGQIIVDDLPAIFIIPTSLSTGDKLGEYQPEISTMINYESLSPFIMPILKTNFERIQKNDNTIERGIAIQQKYVEAMRLKIPENAFFIPQQTYVTYTIETNSTDSIPYLLEPLINYSQKNMSTTNFEIYGCFLARFRSDTEHLRIIQFMLPV
ncbi:MerR family transcriptional regulator [Alkalibacter mobilis]|uniref:MerR family transcriptional regulator n=1 Tax=Alkalibacter mobilis TaxID=2787712 RepID=UPI00189E889E|nr:MerR family transcriptional regulator [Alkalibacter mobilis]MBF7097784.1 MerR family transcriptional regulator [Alkalibacter mobilis]